VSRRCCYFLELEKTGRTWGTKRERRLLLVDVLRHGVLFEQGCWPAAAVGSGLSELVMRWPNPSLGGPFVENQPEKTCCCAVAIHNVIELKNLSEKN
jgi:hypothetical protein